MQQSEIDRELRDAAELIDSTQAAHLAYTGKDGTPRLVPVGFFWTGTDFVIATATTAPKVGALTQRPEVALTIDAGDSSKSALSLLVRGRAAITIVDGVAPEYLAAARRNLDPANAAEFEQNVRQMYPQQARIAVTPTWARFFDYGSGRMPRFLQKLAAQQENRS